MSRTYPHQVLRSTSLARLVLCGDRLKAETGQGQSIPGVYTLPMSNPSLIRGANIQGFNGDRLVPGSIPRDARLLRRILVDRPETRHKRRSSVLIVYLDSVNLRCV